MEGSENDAHPYAENVHFVVDELADWVRDHGSPPFAPAAARFLENLRAADRLLFLPHLLIVTTQSDLIASLPFGKDIPRDPDYVQRAFQTAKNALGRAWKEEEFRRGLRTLLQAVLVRCWTALEAFCADVWEATMNECLLAKELGYKSAERILGQPTGVEIEGVAGKAIEIEVLFRHGLEIKKKLRIRLRMWRFSFKGR